MLILLPFLIFLQVAMAVRSIQPRVISLNSSIYHSLFDATDNKYTNVSEVVCVYRCAGEYAGMVMAFYDANGRICSCSIQSDILNYMEEGNYRNVSVVDLVGPSNATARTGCRADQKGNNSVEKSKCLCFLVIMEKFLYLPL